MENLTSYKSKAHSSIDKLFNNIESLKQKMNHVSDDKKKQFEEGMEDLNKKKKELQKKYEELSKASGDVADDVKDAFEASKDALEDAWEKTKEKFS